MFLLILETGLTLTRKKWTPKVGRPLASLTYLYLESISDVPIRALWSPKIFFSTFFTFMNPRGRNSFKLGTKMQSVGFSFRNTFLISSLVRLAPNSFSPAGGWVGDKTFEIVSSSQNEPREHLHGQLWQHFHNGQLWQSSFRCRQTISQPFFCLFATASPLIKNGGLSGDQSAGKKNPHLFCAGKMVGNEKVVRRKITFQGKNLSSYMSAAMGLMTLS